MKKSDCQARIEKYFARVRDQSRCFMFTGSRECRLTVCERALVLVNAWADQRMIEAVL